MQLKMTVKDNIIVVLSFDPWINRLHGASVMSLWCELNKYINTVVYMVFEQNNRIYSFPPCNNVRIIPIRGLPLVDFLFCLSKFLRVLMKEKPSVVICDPNAFLSTIIYKALFKNNVVTVLLILSRPILTKSLRGKLNKALFKLSLILGHYFADKITAISPFERVNFALWGRIPYNKFITLPSPVDPVFASINCEKEDKNRLRRELGLERFADKIILLYYGTINRERGIIDLVNAFSKIKLKDIVLLIVGDGPDKRAIKNVKASENILVLPPLPYKDVPKLLCASDIGVLPFPNVDDWKFQTPTKLVEMITIGMPVIATSLPSIRLALRDYKCKEIINSIDAETLENAIRRILDSLSKNKKMRRETKMDYLVNCLALKLLESIYRAISSRNRNRQNA